jgi:hypothetical protein
MSEWINALTKKPPRGQPVIIFGRVKGGRKSQVMVAWRLDEWTIKDEHCTEWRGVRNGPYGGRTIEVSCVTEWMPLPKVSNAEITGLSG